MTGSFLGLGAKIATPSSLDDDVDDPVQHSPEIGEHDDDGEEFLRDHSKVVPHADDPQGPPLHEEGGDKQAHQLGRTVGGAQGLSLASQHGFDFFGFRVDFPPRQNVQDDVQR